MILSSPNLMPDSKLVILVLHFNRLQHSLVRFVALLTIVISFFQLKQMVEDGMAARTDHCTLLSLSERGERDYRASLQFMLGLEPSFLR
jgi:hypothetical protein